MTRLLDAVRRDEPNADERLLELVYDELRRVARGKMAALPPGQTLQPTALVSEAYLKLIGPDGQTMRWESRAHFFGAAARAMRNILVDQARRRTAQKRGGADARAQPLDDQLITAVEVPTTDLIALDAALEELEGRDPRGHQVVMLRFFAGLSETQVAEALGTSERTVRREWSHARAWLRRRLDGEPDA